MRQFAVNVMHIERTPHGDKERNKAIDIINKNIDAHNKEVDKNKREIKNLIKSKSNPVETLGGLAALIYEYSDRDPKLKLFWRQIALRGNGYFKEYFLYGQKDEEKINQEPNSFFQIKTQRPKSWSSLVGLGNDYVDKRGWLKYSYDMLKYPIVIGGLGYAASRNSTTLKEALTQGKEYVGKGVKALHKKYRDVTGATRRDEEMKKRDEEIDEMVFELYGLTEEERRVVLESNGK